MGGFCLEIRPMKSKQPKESFTIRLEDFESAELDHLMKVHLPNSQNLRAIRREKLWLVGRLLAEAIHAQYDYITGDGDDVCPITGGAIPRERIPLRFDVDPTQRPRRHDRLAVARHIESVLSAAADLEATLPDR